MSKNTKIRSYSELIQLKTFEERFQYLKLSGNVCEETFGRNRHLNQTFYRSPEWRRIHDQVIIRDNGCDLGIDGYDIHGKIYVHHMNPIDEDSILERRLEIMDPEYLICVSFDTHNAIHYSDETALYNTLIERKPGDTKLW